MNNEKESEVKRNALKDAVLLRDLAERNGDPDLFDQAAHFFLVAGNHNKQANDCYDAADILRKAAQS